jgi:8-amino-7-oxononanoate synthase
MRGDDSLDRLLKKRVAAHNLRSLKFPQEQLVDFSSNDYLGLANSPQLKEAIVHQYLQQQSKNGSTGSRLLTGNTELIEDTEKFLSSLFDAESSLLFSSGYMANLAFFSTVPQKTDTILYDELSHACIKDGMRLSNAKRLPFRHNDLDDLSRKISISTGNLYIACESVYSMDGDMAPLTELAALCQKYGARLVVDEAHSTGIWGKSGQGLVYELGLQEHVFAVIHTFGKALGIHGASISGSEKLTTFLINFARPFIYTTAPSDFEVISIRTAFDYLSQHPEKQANLFHKINYFQQQYDTATSTAIQTVIVGGNERTIELAKGLIETGFDIRPILSPTVKEGNERLRICLHSYNSEEEISSLIKHLHHSLI